MTETKTSIHNETVSGLTAPQRVLFEYPFEYAICGNGAVLTRFSLGDENEHELPGERSATVPPTLGNHPLVAIREGALSCCRYLSDVVDIPDTVLFIGMGAFAATDIASIRIPASVAFIGEKAFALTSNLQSIEVDPSNPFYSSPNGWLTENGKFDLIRYTSKEKNSSAHIPKSIRFIEKRAFSGCDISSVIMEEIEGIDEGAFMYCSNLTSVKLSDNLRWIKDRAFWRCPNLTEIEIPQNVREIGQDVFRDCPPDLVLTVAEGSYAERWARENGVAYKTL